MRKSGRWKNMCQDEAMIHERNTTEKAGKQKYEE